MTPVSFYGRGDVISRYGDSLSDSQAGNTIWTSTDSIDFTDPVEFKVYAYSGVEGKPYTITINVHKQEPDTISWKKFDTQLFNAGNLSEQKAVYAKEKEAAELRKQYFGPEGELMKKRQELISPIQDAIYNAVKEIATQRGYDAVIDRASAQSMIFASPRIDISNEVLAKLGYSN